MSDSTPAPTDPILKAIQARARSRANDLIHSAVTKIWNGEQPPDIPGLNRGYIMEIAGIGLTRGNGSPTYITKRAAAVDAVAAHLTKKAILIVRRAAVEREGQELAGTIRQAIAMLLKRHQKEYGWTPGGISVAMIECTGLGDRIPQYRVGEVSVGTPAGITSGRGWPEPPPPPILETKGSDE